ncbi:MAG: hypothetical protein ACLT40_00905 [Fusobacterium sp.]
MEIRYDLLSSIDRFMLLENSIKDKLSEFATYTHWVEKIFQIKLLQNIFDVKEICIDEEYEEKKNSMSAKTFKEYIINRIEHLDVYFICEYKGIQMPIKCKCEQISQYYRQIAFTSYIDDDITKPQYNYVLNFTIKEKEYMGSVSIDMPKGDKMISKKLIDENIRQIKKHLDSALDKFKTYEYNKEILENM